MFRRCNLGFGVTFGFVLLAKLHSHQYTGIEETNIEGYRYQEVGVFAWSVITISFDNAGNYRGTLYFIA